jgi:hypothetical protein
MRSEAFRGDRSDLLKHIRTSLAKLPKRPSRETVKLKELFPIHALSPPRDTDHSERDLDLIP